MPSTVFYNGSGYAQLLSGNPWSGFIAKPQGYVTVMPDPGAVSGSNIYYGYSGSMTINSGTGDNNTGLLDGFILPKNIQTLIPRSIFQNNSGTFNIYMASTGSSGLSRVYFEVY